MDEEDHDNEHMRASKTEEKEKQRFTCCGERRNWRLEGGGEQADGSALCCH